MARRDKERPGSPPPDGVPATAAAAGDEALASWQAARLAGVSAALARFSHDLRGVLAPALLAAGRLQANPDPAVRRSAEVLVRAVERAMDTLRDGLGPIRASLPAIARLSLPLREATPPAPEGLTLIWAAAPDCMVTADPALLRQAWTSLFAYLRLAGASRATLTAAEEPGCWHLTIDHDATRDDDAAAAEPLELLATRELVGACDGVLSRPRAGRLVLTLPRG